MYKTSRHSIRVRHFYFRRLYFYSLAALSIIFWFVVITFFNSVVNDAKFPSHDCSVAIVAACKGKNSTLYAALDSWLGARGVSKVVLVDWSSTPSYASSLAPRYLISDKLHIVRVEGQKNYILTWAVNFAVSQAKECDKILKLDCDSVITSDFIERNALQAGSFLTGDWRAARDENEVHLNGVCSFFSADFWGIGGYDERIQSYGWDDEDLYARLQGRGLERKLFDMDTIHHLYHMTGNRVKDVPAMTKNANFETAVNRILAGTLPLWNASSNPKTAYQIIDSGRVSYAISKPIKSSREMASRDDFRNAVKSAAYEFFIGLDGYKWAPCMDTLQASYLSHLVNSHFLAAQKSKTKKMLVVELHHGLGNRLRTLSSAINFAQKSNRWLRIISPIDLHFNASLSELFHLPEEMPDVWNEFDISELNLFPFDRYDYMDEKVKNAYIDHHSDNHIYVRSSFRLNTSFQDWDEENRILRSIHPVDEVMQLIAEKLKSVQGSANIYQVGVHVRNSDPRTELPGIPKSDYPDSGWDELIKFRNSSRVEKFGAEMRRIKDNVPGARFFVSVDSVDSLQWMQSNLAFNVDYVDPVDCTSRSILCLRVAYANLLMLSYSKEILGSDWSSFTEIAGCIAGVTPRLAGKDF